MNLVIPVNKRKKVILGKKLAQHLTMITAHIKHEGKSLPALKERVISVIVTRLNSYFLTLEEGRATEFLKRVLKLLIMLNRMLFRCSPMTFY